MNRYFKSYNINVPHVTLTALHAPVKYSNGTYTNLSGSHNIAMVILNRISLCGC